MFQKGKWEGLSGTRNWPRRAEEKAVLIDMGAKGQRYRAVHDIGAVGSLAVYQGSPNLRRRWFPFPTMRPDLSRVRLSDLSDRATNLPVPSRSQSPAKRRMILPVRFRRQLSFILHSEGD